MLADAVVLIVVGAVALLLPSCGLVTSAGGSRTEMEHFRDRLWGGRTAAGVTGEA